MDKPDFNIVTECGDKNRTIVRYHDTCYIGCFTGTYDEAVEAIKNSYIGDSCVEYIKKLDMLYSNSISDDMVPAKNSGTLIWASVNGYLDAVKWLVAHGMDVTAENNYALKRASGNGHLEVVKYLIANGADVRANDNYALIRSIENGHLEVVKWLVSQGADVTANNNYALKRATRNEHTEIVNWITEYLNSRDYKIDKPDFNVITECGEYQRTIYRYYNICYIGCFIGNYDEIIEAIHKKYEGVECIAYIRKIDELYAGALPDDMVSVDDNACLKQAARHGHLDVLKWLASRGVDVIDQNNLAILEATYGDALHVVKWLTMQGADVTVQNNDAIIDAAFNGNVEVVKWLALHGADITARNNQAMICASECGHLEVVKWLVEHGADIEAQNNEALKLACQYEYNEIIDWISTYKENKKGIK